MPETGIGLFPDIGAGWVLSRLPGEMGTWMALTGARLRAADGLHLNLCTHYVESAKLEALKALLVAAPEGAAKTLARFSGDPGPAPLAGKQKALDAVFEHGTVEAIVKALEAGSSWAAGTGRDPGDEIADLDEGRPARTAPGPREAQLRRRDRPGVPPGLPHHRHARLPGRRARGGGRQGQRPPLEPGPAGGCHRRDARRPVRAVRGPGGVVARCPWAMGACRRPALGALCAGRSERVPRCRLIAPAPPPTAATWPARAACGAPQA